MKVYSVNLTKEEATTDAISRIRGAVRSLIYKTSYMTGKRTWDVVYSHVYFAETHEYIIDNYSKNPF